MRVPLPAILAALALLPPGSAGARPKAPSAPDVPAPFEARVVRVHDGDTVDVLLDGAPRRIRLFGIDAPERYQDHSIQSRKHLGALVHHKTVRVVVRDIDRYGRWVAELTVGELDVGLAMVKAGYAWWYERYAADRASLREAQEEAQAARRGLWVDKDPIMPSMFRRSKKRVPAS
ncbi:MAG: thermonuclease family protein [Elusimicrobia bacterium]|nr:thermonuclease family protein [Elusimicrobiota bacterium]